MPDFVNLWIYLSSTPLFGLTATLTVYLSAHAMYLRLGQVPLANPVLWSMVVLAAGLLAFGVPYPTYFAGAQFIHFLLGPAVVALAWPLWMRRAELRRRGVYAPDGGPRLDALSDLVALGTVADVVKLDANNRLLVTQGLQRMRAGRMQPGVRALFAVAGREPRTASGFDLGFALGPRINAAGRLADMSLGIACLTTDDEAQALEMARELDNINRERRTIEAEMRDQALAAMEAPDAAAGATVCVFDPGWHQGVVGLVASRLKEKFWRPTLAFAPAGEDELRGSGRSIPDVHLRDALDLVSKRHPGLIRKFGGHAMAAGLTLGSGDFAAFAPAFDAAVRELTGRDRFEPLLETDGSLESGYANAEVAGLLQQQVWGAGFAAPLFLDEFTVRSQRLVGGKHLKLALERGHQRFDAIWFGHDQSLPERIQAAYRLEQNIWNGMVSVQLVIEHAA
ncbi:LrgB family protein [Bordetella bronchiseptica]|uniref:LrgB family protein n=1 Tax=Bordetella bronchiseptica TaxID=518 RepID=UPI0022793405|nr:LrgB family protein [Bordetella bronchiseptica]